MIQLLLDLVNFFYAFVPLLVLYAVIDWLTNAKVLRCNLLKFLQKVSGVIYRGLILFSFFLCNACDRGFTANSEASFKVHINHLIKCAVTIFVI